MRQMVIIELDRPRMLKFTTNALCELEDLFGLPVDKWGEVPNGLNTLRLMLYAGLKHEDPSITIEKAGDLIDLAESVQAVADKIAEAMTAASPPSKNE